MASFFFEQDDGAVGVGNTFDVLVVLEPAGAKVNAMEGVLHFDPSSVRFLGANTARSAVTLWVQDPTGADGSSGNVPFSGITPGGFGEVLIAPSDGYPDTLAFVARFEALRSGTTEFSIIDPQTYANDGSGTAVPTDMVEYHLSIATERQSATIAETNGWAAADATPPEAFQPMIERNVQAFDGKRVVIFSTTDKLSGIDYYEVSENGGSFVRASSPYILEDQEGGVTVTVRAIDHAGNVQTAEVSSGMNLAIGWTLFGGAVVVGAIALVFVRTWKKRGIR